MSICCSLTYAFLGCFLCASWPEPEPTALVYQGAALANWAAWPGLHHHPLSHRCQRKTQLYFLWSKDTISLWSLRLASGKLMFIKVMVGSYFKYPLKDEWALLFQEAGLVTAALLSICSFKNDNHLLSTYQWASHHMWDCRSKDPCRL